MSTTGDANAKIMARILVEDLDPIILEKLEALAKQHGRSLQEELKHILQTADEKFYNALKTSGYANNLLWVENI